MDDVIGIEHVNTEKIVVDSSAVQPREDGALLAAYLEVLKPRQAKTINACPRTYQIPGSP